MMNEIWAVGLDLHIETTVVKLHQNAKKTSILFYPMTMEDRRGTTDDNQ